MIVGKKDEHRVQGMGKEGGGRKGLLRSLIMLRIGGILGFEPAYATDGKEDASGEWMHSMGML